MHIKYIEKLVLQLYTIYYSIILFKTNVLVYTPINTHSHTDIHIIYVCVSMFIYTCVDTYVRIL